MNAVMTPAAQASWSSDHVFIPPGRMSDLFLVHSVAPFLRDLAGVRKWFFIRYGEGGPHVRIRVDVESPAVADTVHRRWRDAASDYLDGSEPGPEWQAREEPTFDPGSVQRIEYEPEIDRYGGPRVMPSNERLFCRSTTLALGIIAATLDDFERRIGQAVKIMIASAGTLSDDPKVIGEIFRRYAEGWKRFLTPFGWSPDIQPISLSDLAAVQASLNESASGGRSYTSVWRVSLAELLNDLDAENVRPLTANKTDIVMSQLHMFCNRLGLSPSMEFHLASQIGSAL
jgi:thiopeptide-type bacteriocin biosynthesis protein